MSSLTFTKSCSFNEVNKAVEWWSSKIIGVPHQNIWIFKQNLEGLIYLRIHKHWYLDNPSKGSGYRSIINDHHTDPILLHACNAAQIHPSKLPSDCVLVLSPGIVRVRSLATEIEQVIYQIN